MTKYRLSVRVMNGGDGSAITYFHGRHADAERLDDEAMEDGDGSGFAESSVDSVILEQNEKGELGFWLNDWDSYDPVTKKFPKVWNPLEVVEENDNETASQ